MCRELDERSRDERAMRMIGIPRPNQFQDMPWGIWYLLLYLGTWGVIGLCIVLLAPLDIGSYSVGREAVTGPEFLRDPQLWPVLVSAVPAGLAALGLLRRRAWARLVLGLPFLLTAAGWYLGASASGLQALLAFVLGLAVWRYSYRNRAATDFFGR
jgi:hypothetical protein